MVTKCFVTACCRKSAIRALSACAQLVAKITYAAAHIGIDSALAIGADFGTNAAMCCTIFRLAGEDLYHATNGIGTIHATG